MVTGTTHAEQRTVRKLCDSPRVYVVENFLSEEECDHIITEARPHLKRSTVVDHKGAEGRVDTARTSQGMFFPTQPDDKVIRRIEKRISNLTKLPIENGEGLQILNYVEGAEYRPHWDYFDPKTPGGLIHFNRGGQRLATVIMYLNVPDEGGETIFPKVQISITPQKGKALLFYNCTPDGVEDPMSLHGGAPVIRGEKWIATKWLRKGEFK